MYSLDIYIIFLLKYIIYIFKKYIYIYYFILINLIMGTAQEKI